MTITVKVVVASNIAVKVVVAAGIAVTVAKMGLQGPPNTNTIAEGANQTVQFNDQGTLRGATALTWNKATNVLTSHAVEVNKAGVTLAGVPSLTVWGPTTDNNWSGTIALKSQNGSSVDWRMVASAFGLDFQQGATIRWRIDAGDGSLHPVAGNVADIGNLTWPLRTGYFGTMLRAGYAELNFAGAYGSALNGRAALTIFGPADNNYAGEIHFRSQNSAVSGAVRLSNAGFQVSLGPLNTPTSVLTYTGSVLSVQAGATAQTFKLANTYTDASNNEFGHVRWNSNVLEFGSTQSGSGAARAVRVRTDGAVDILFAINSTDRWKIDGTGAHFLALTDNTQDIGATGATRPRTGYFGTSVVSPQFTMSTGNAGFYSPSPNVLASITSGVDRWRWDASGNYHPFATNAYDLGLVSNAVRSGHFGTSVFVYNQATDAANYDRVALRINGNFAELITQQLGTGAARHLGLRTPAGLSIWFGPGGGSDEWRFTAGNFGAAADNAVDIGTNISNRPRTVYVGTSVKTPNVSSGTGTLFVDGDTINFRTIAGTQRWQIDASGHLGSNSVNTYDLGSFASPVRTGYFGTSVFVNNVFTDASNYERGFARFVSNIFELGAEKAGTGVNARLRLRGDVGGVLISTGGTDRWSFNATGDFLSQDGDNLHNIGASSSNRPASIFVGSTVHVNKAGSIGIGVPSLFVYGASTDNNNGGVISLTSFDGTTVSNVLLAGTINGMGFLTGGTTRWLIGYSSGHFLGGLDNTYDIGAVAGNRPRTGYFGTSLVTPVLSSPTNIIEQRNGVNAQTWRLLESYTDAANWQGISTYYDAPNTRWVIGVVAAGSGGVRAIMIDATPARTVTLSGNAVAINLGGANAWNFAAAGHLQPADNNARDFGTSSAMVRTGYFGTDVVVGRDVLLARRLALGVGGYIMGSTTMGGTIVNNDLDTLNVAKFNNDQTTHFWGAVSPSPFKAGVIDLGTAASKWRTGIFGTSVESPLFAAYNVFTDTSNYERAVIRWISSELNIGSEAVGTGTLRNTTLLGNAINFKTAGSYRWNFSASGHLVAEIDNTYDIGSAAASRPRTLFAASNVRIAGGLGAVSASGATTEIWLGPVAGAAMLNTPTGLFGHLASGNNSVLSWQTGVVSVTGDIRPEAFNTRDLGTTALYFRAAYVANVHAYGANCQFSVYRRDTLALAWAMYSTGGNLHFYDNLNSVDRMVLAPTTGILSINGTGPGVDLFPASPGGYGVFRNSTTTELKAGSTIDLIVGSTVIARAVSTGLNITNSKPLMFDGATAWVPVSGGLELRNVASGGTAQSVYIYNTYTDASNYERAFQSWTTNEFRIGIGVGGTGVATRAVVMMAKNYVWKDPATALVQMEFRPTLGTGALGIFNAYTDASNNEQMSMEWNGSQFHFRYRGIGTGSTALSMGFYPGGSLFLGSGGFTTRWQLNPSGHLLAFADNTYDIGAAGATRPRDLHLGGAIAAGGNIVFGTAASNPKISFGGTTSGTAALRRLAASPDQIDAVLADESAYAKFKALLFEAVGGGLKFPATQVTSADANTLDDYEEQTFTPTITFGGLSTGITYSVQDAVYTKVGRQVSFRLYIQLSNKGSAVGAMKVAGLPFTNGAGSSYNSLNVWANVLTGISGQVMAYVEPGATTVVMQYLGTGTATQLADTNFTNTSAIMLSGTYHV